METGKAGINTCNTSRQDKKILTTTLAKSLGDADLETRDGAYHRRDAFPPVAHCGNVVARHASHRRVFSAFTFTPSFMGVRPARDHRPRTRARDGRTLDAHLMRRQQIIMTFGARVQIMSTTRSACTMVRATRDDGDACP